MRLHNRPAQHHFMCCWTAGAERRMLPAAAAARLPAAGADAVADAVTRLTQTLHKMYTSNRAYYAASTLGGLTHADQRITEDVEKFCFSISDLYSHTFKVICCPDSDQQTAAGGGTTRVCLWQVLGTGSPCSAGCMTAPFRKE